jgi:hypothetical protein
MSSDLIIENIRMASIIRGSDEDFLNILEPPLLMKPGVLLNNIVTA